MLRALFFLLIIALINGCSDTVYNEIFPISEFGPRNALKTSVLDGQVLDYDPAVDPKTIRLKWAAWTANGSNEESVVLDNHGAFRFTVSNNVIQDYFFIFGGEIFEFVLKPGTEVSFELLRSEQADGFELGVRNNRFVQQSIELFRELLPNDYWRSSRAEFKDATDVTSLKAAVREEEKQLFARLDTVAAYSDLEDVYLRSIAEQFINFRFKRNVPFAATRLVGTDRRAQDSIRQIAFFSECQSLLELPVYNSNQIDYYQHYFGALLNSSYAKGFKHASKKHYAYYLELLEAQHWGLTADVLHAMFLRLSMRSPLGPLSLSSEIKVFIANCPYPGLTTPLQEQLAILTGDTEVEDQFAQRFLEISSELDNPIPNILSANEGKVVVLDFWATWCAPCLKELADTYPALVKEYDPEKVSFILLAKSSPKENWRSTIAELAFSATHYLLTNEQAEVCDHLFSIGGIPHTVVFNQCDELVHNNTVRAGKPLESALANLLTSR